MALPEDQCRSKEYRQLEAEFKTLLPSLNGVRGDTPLLAADAFSEIAIPFTAKWGFEIGANILFGRGGYRLDDVTLGYFGGVTIPENLSARANVHTHPSRAGFSGAITYQNGNLSNYHGDLLTNYRQNIDGYVYRVGGGAWYFNQSTFRSSLSAAMKSGGTVDARWYVEQVR